MGKSQICSFEPVKEKLSLALVLALPNYDKKFEVERDASANRIKDFLIQKGRSIEFFSEKINEVRQKWSTNKQEFYAIIRALKH